MMCPARLVQMRGVDTAETYVRHRRSERRGFGTNRTWVLRKAERMLNPERRKDCLIQRRVGECVRLWMFGDGLKEAACFERGNREHREEVGLKTRHA